MRNGRWQPMFRPINPDRAFSGVNLAESFAECYAKKYDVDVRLICCADGGTALSQWMPGTLLYDNAVAQASKARAADIRHCRDFMASVRDRLQPGAICFVFAPAEYYA